MPGYGILDAQSGKGLLPWSWAVKRMSEERIYWISTTRPDGRPHAMPVWGVWFGNQFYFSTGEQSRKARNIVEDPRCVVGAEHGMDAVVVEGAAELVAEEEVRKRFAEIYGKKYEWDMEGFEEPIYAVRPSVVFGLISGLTETATRWVFDEEDHEA
jgi:nitroimidazol reductase NimA-like FMN-containing flavoprotein (pyridoxamine 5'-phosphate oxidase superfamily)